MKSGSKLGTALLAVVLPVMAAWWSAQPAVSDSVEIGEEEIHRAPGMRVAGKPATSVPEKNGRIKLKVTAEGRPVYCRVNVVGPDGDYYEPTDNPLAPWSLSRLGNRKGKGPFRYYGWFFYCDGACEIRVPAGESRIEVWRGIEFRPVTVTKQVAAGQTATVDVALKRTVDMAASGWYSGDTHIHLNRRSDKEDQRALDLIAAEDLRFGHILCMNAPRFYRPVMDQQIWHQMRGLGGESVERRGESRISSGQEYRCGTFGHICFIGGSRLVDADGLKTNPNNWPPFGMVADELHGIGGFAFHAHGGYSKEIFIDFAQGATDGVELLQFAEYRGISLEGWYHILNAGYRFPAVGGSDYPYCRALGDCRTYVHLTGEPTFENWNKAAAAGQSFFTTGPLLQMTVEDKLPGETLSLPAGKQELSIKLRLDSLVSPVDEIQLIAGGTIRARKRLEGKERTEPVAWNTKMTVNDSTWVAIRAFSKSPSGREDSEAHTNPVYVSLGGKQPRNRASILWLLKKIDERITFQQGREFAEREQVLTYFQASRDALAKLLQSEE